MILRFDEFCDKNDRMFEVKKDDDFDYINETLSVSMDVNDATDEVVSFIESYTGEKITIEQGDICSIVKFRKNPVINVFGCDCEFDLKIYELQNDVNLKSFVENNDFGARIIVNHNVIDGNVSLNFVIRGEIIMQNKKIVQKSRTILTHELRHAYEQTMIYNGLPEFDYRRILELSRKWREIYMKCVNYIKLSGRYKISKMLDGPELYKIVYVSYCCDVSEVSALTQEAYEDCKDCVSKDEVKTKMKNTDLHMILKLFDSILHMFEDDDIQKTYDRNKKKYYFDEFPTIHNLLKLIMKRYMKIRTNYGKVLALICGRFDENEGLNLIDVKY